MVEPITTATGIAVGGWFAGKVFGPSAERLGDNLLVYLENRVPRIFARAERIAQDEGLDPKPITPGLLTRLIVDASMSDDDEEITEWWANLILDASLSGSNRHAVLSDMMAIIGPKEAQFLDRFYKMIALNRPSENAPWTFSRFVVEHHVSENASREIGWMFPLDRENAEQASEAVQRFADDIPARPVAWGLPSKITARWDEGEPFDLVIRGERRAQWFEGNEGSFEILERAQVLRTSRHEIRGLKSPYGWVQFVEFTQLGMAFYEACTGLSRSWELKK